MSELMRKLRTFFKVFNSKKWIILKKNQVIEVIKNQGFVLGLLVGQWNNDAANTMFDYSLSIKSFRYMYKNTCGPRSVFWARRNVDEISSVAERAPASGHTRFL